MYSIYSTHNEGKSVVSERFIRTLKNKIYKYMTSILEDVYIDKLDDIVNKYSNTYNSTIKIKPVDGKWNAYIDSSKGIINKDPKFKIGDIVRISKYENIFAKDYVQNWSEQVFVIRKVKNTVPWTCVVVVTTAQLHSTKPELRFCAGLNPAHCVLEIRDGKDLWQWSRLEIRLNAFRRSTIPQK